jgi:hypothetical protein
MAKDQPRDPVSERRRRRAIFLAELAEARALRSRVAPRRARNARLREAIRMSTFRQGLVAYAPTTSTLTHALPPEAH